MMKRSVLTVMLGMIAVSGIRVSADDSTVIYEKRTKLVSVVAKNSDVRDVVDKIFKTAINATYDMPANVKGKVTFRALSAKPEDALQVALAEVGAEFSVNKNVYIIQLKPEPKGRTRIGIPEIDHRRISMRMNGVSFNAIASEIANHFGLKLNNSAEVGGRLTVGYDRNTLDEAMQQLVEHSNQLGHISWKVQGDTLVIVPLAEVVDRGSTIPMSFKKRVDVTARDRPIAEIMHVIEQQTRSKIQFDRDVPSPMPINVVAKNEIAWDLIHRIAKIADLKIEVLSNSEIKLLPRTIISRPGSSPIISYCPKCGTGLQKDWRVCPKCGRPVDR
ncbi:MAG: zinc ribbon domain-containing protein [Chthonomonadales bacterium]